MICTGVPSCAAGERRRATLTPYKKDSTRSLCKPKFWGHSGVYQAEAFDLQESKPSLTHVQEAPKVDVKSVCDWSYRSHIVVCLHETMVPQYDSVTCGRLLPEMARKLAPRFETPASSAFLQLQPWILRSSSKSTLNIEFLFAPRVNMQSHPPN